MTTTMTNNLEQFSKFESLQVTVLEEIVGGKSAAYQAGYYTGKAVQVVIGILPFL
jgi:hypothetical protein